MAAECDKSAGLPTATPTQATAGSGDIADAEKVLAKHFGESTERNTATKAKPAGSEMSEDEAERILSQHFK